MNSGIERSLALKESGGANNRDGAGRTAKPDKRALSTEGKRTVGRRFFMKSLALGGTALFPVSAALAGRSNQKREMAAISEGDAAILRFLAAAEILETDAWQQYNELSNLEGPYMDALENIDE